MPFCSRDNKGRDVRKHSHNKLDSILFQNARTNQLILYATVKGDTRTNFFFLILLDTFFVFALGERVLYHNAIPDDDDDGTLLTHFLFVRTCFVLFILPKLVRSKELLDSGNRNLFYPTTYFTLPHA